MNDMVAGVALRLERGRGHRQTVVVVCYDLVTVVKMLKSLLTARL